MGLGLKKAQAVLLGELRGGKGDDAGQFQVRWAFCLHNSVTDSLDPTGRHREPIIVVGVQRREGTLAFWTPSLQAESSALSATLCSNGKDGLCLFHSHRTAQAGVEDSLREAPCSLFRRVRFPGWRWFWGSWKPFRFYKMASDKRVKRKHKTRISDKECFNSAKRLQSHNEQLNYSRDGHWGGLAPRTRREDVSCGWEYGWRGE